MKTLRDLLRFIRPRDQSSPQLLAELEAIRAHLDRAEIAAIQAKLQAGTHKHYYSEVQPPEQVRSLATLALQIAQRELGLSGLRPRFFKRHYGQRWPHPADFAFASDLDLLGAFQSDDAVWVKGEFYGIEPLVSTVLHEARHAERHRAGIVPEDAERDAEDFASRVGPKVIAEIKARDEQSERPGVRGATHKEGVGPTRPPDGRRGPGSETAPKAVWGR